MREILLANLWMNMRNRVRGVVNDRTQEEGTIQNRKIENDWEVKKGKKK